MNFCCLNFCRFCASISPRDFPDPQDNGSVRVVNPFPYPEIFPIFLKLFPPVCVYSYAR
jgi:hypothetical protein